MTWKEVLKGWLPDSTPRGSGWTTSGKPWLSSGRAPPPPLGWTLHLSSVSSYPKRQVLETCSAEASPEGHEAHGHTSYCARSPRNRVLSPPSPFPILASSPSSSIQLLFAPQSSVFLNFRAPVWLVTHLAKELQHLINRKLAQNVTFGL